MHLCLHRSQFHVRLLERGTAVYMVLNATVSVSSAIPFCHKPHFVYPLLLPLQTSLKLVMDPPAGLKANLSAVLGALPAEILASGRIKVQGGDMCKGGCVQKQRQGQECEGTLRCRGRMCKGIRQEIRMMNLDGVRRGGGLCGNKAYRTEMRGKEQKTHLLLTSCGEFREGEKTI